MAIVCPDVGEVILLQYLVGMVAAGSPVLHLYSNNVTPGETTVKSQLTEVSSDGYAAITLLSSNWTTEQSGGTSSAVYSEQTFTFNTTTVAYGYYLTDTSNNLLIVERFSGDGFFIPDGGGTISITPKIGLT